MRSNALAAPSFDTGNLLAGCVVNDNRPMPLLRLVADGQNACLENFLPLPHLRPCAKAPQPQPAPRKITVVYDRSASGQTIYGYVGGNPISGTDPFGLSGEMSFPPGSGGMSYPPEDLPGGPYTPAGPGQAPNTWYGPAQDSGPRAICRGVPPEGAGGPPGSTGYWKYQLPGNKGWNRVTPAGEPISPEQAHPGSGGTPDPAPIIDEPPVIIEEPPIILIEGVLRN